MADINALTNRDIEAWFEQTTPSQATQVLNTVLDKVASYPQQDRDRFIQQMSPKARQMFEGQHV